MAEDGFRLLGMIPRTASRRATSMTTTATAITTGTESSHRGVAQGGDDTRRGAGHRPDRSGLDGEHSFNRQPLLLDEEEEVRQVVAPEAPTRRIVQMSDLDTPEGVRADRMTGPIPPLMVSS